MIGRGRHGNPFRTGVLFDAVSPRLEPFVEMVVSERDEELRDVVGEDRDTEEDHQNFFPTRGAVGLDAEQQTSDEDECDADPVSGSNLSFVVEGHYDLLVAKPQGVFADRSRESWWGSITARIKSMSLEGLPSQLRLGSAFVIGNGESVSVDQKGRGIDPNPR